MRTICFCIVLIAGILRPVAAHAGEWDGGVVGVTVILDDTADRAVTHSILALPTGPLPVGHYSKTAPALGLVAGYRVDIGPVVIGAEADADWMHTTLTEQEIAATSFVRPRWRASLRAVAGVPVGKALVFGTGGWGVNGSRYQYRLNFGAPVPDTHVRRTTGGIVVGGGVELALGQLHPRIEYRHARYGKTVNGAQSLIFRQRQSSDSLRLSLMLAL